MNKHGSLGVQNALQSDVSCKTAVVVRDYSDKCKKRQNQDSWITLPVNDHEIQFKF